MILKNKNKCECGSDKIFMATMPSGYFCFDCGKEIKENKKDE